MAETANERRNRQYWKNRQEEIHNAIWRSQEEIEEELTEIYAQGKRRLEREMESFYGRFAGERGLTIQEARKRISKVDLSDFDDVITARTRNPSRLTQKQIEAYDLMRARFTVTRLDMLINELELELVDLYGQQQITMEEFLARSTLESYRETSELVGNFTRLPHEEIQFIVNYPWSGDEFSDLLWHNKDLLVTSLRRNITSGLIAGDSVQQMARRLRRDMDSSRYASERIIRTETGHVMNQGTLKSYQDNDLEQYEFIAEIDTRTSDVCRRADGKVHNLDDAVIGENFPPMHPNCRSAIIPVIEDDDE